MTHLLRAELIKLLRRKAYLLMVVILAGLVGMAAFLLVVFPRVAPDLAEGLTPVAKPDGFILGAQQVLGQTWFPVILAVMMLGTEMSGTFWATSLTREARRWRHVAARLVVISGASWAAMAAAITGFSVVVALGAVGDGVLSVGRWLQIAGGALLVQVAWVALGLGLVGLFRSVGPAIGAGIAFAFGESLLALWPPYANVSLSSSSIALVGEVEGVPMMSMVPGAGIDPTHAVMVVAGWAVFGLALAWWSLVYREA